MCTLQCRKGKSVQVLDYAFERMRSQGYAGQPEQRGKRSDSYPSMNRRKIDQGLSQDIAVEAEKVDYGM